jgi:hypothetical protein
VVASSDCLLDQRDAGGAGGVEDGEVHGRARSRMREITQSM